MNLEQLDQNRLKRQQLGLSKWVNAGCRGTGVYCTGFGKTIMGCLAIHRMNQKDPSKITIVSVPTDHLRNQWRSLVTSFGLKNVYVQTWQSLINEDVRCDLLILDEVHTNTAPESMKVFDIPNRWLLGFTASLREDPDAAALIAAKAPAFDEIGLAEAELNGWVSTFTVYNLAVKFNLKDQTEYETLQKQYIKYFSTFDYDFEMAMNAMSNKQLREKIAANMGWEEKVVMIHALGYNKAMRARKELLYRASCLLDTAEQLIRRFPERKIITFSESTGFADALTSRVAGSHAYHSQLQTIVQDGKKYGKTVRKRAAMEGFINGKFRVLNTAKALNVGADVPGVDMSIICSFNSSMVDSIQRTGRAVRYSEGKHALEINLYIKGTQSEKWLRNKQRKTPNIRWIESIDQVIG